MQRRMLKNGGARATAVSYRSRLQGRNISQPSDVLPTGSKNVAAFNGVVLELALSRKSFQCDSFARAMVLVHSLRFLRISTNSSVVHSSSLPLLAKLACQVLRTLLRDLWCCFNSGVNRLFEYGDGLSKGVLASTASCTVLVRWLTTPSSCSAVMTV